MPLSNFDEATAAYAVRPSEGALSRDDIAAVHRAGKEYALRNRRHHRPVSLGSASGWLVTFLNTDGAFVSMLPELYERIRRAAVTVDREHWNVAADIEHVNYRVVEYHTMRSCSMGNRPRAGCTQAPLRPGQPDHD